MEKFSGKLLEKLRADIEAVLSREQDGFKVLKAVLRLIRDSLAELKKYLVAHPFSSTSDEIDFFKSIKPVFLAYRIYYLEKFNIDTNTPAGDAEVLKVFYRSELQMVKRFFEHCCFHYQYYLSGATELDELYFTRGKETQSVLIPELPEADPDFSTGCDYLFAKIRAYELLQDYLLKKLEALDPKLAIPVAKERDLPELKWTGDKVNLVEVIYALYFTGQLNHGNADIALIIQFMERYFHIDLSRAYRDFIDIRKRKVSSPTRYLDQMRESIHKRIDDDLAFKPNKRDYKSIG